MALQFRSDDTTTWTPKYGTGVAGTYNLNGFNFTYTVPNTSFSGTAAAFSGTLGSPTGFTPGQIVWIFQTNYAPLGVHQFNFILDVDDNTVTFAFPLQANFNGTAQIIVINQYRDIYLTASSIFTPTWNGSYGGILPLMASQRIVVDGASNIIANAVGYRGGGPGVNQQPGGRGESFDGTFPNPGTSQNWGGGGGGKAGRGFDAGHGGGGGGYKTGGSNGGGHNDGDDGQGGGTYGTDTLTQIYFGSGGGGNGMDTNLVPMSGAAGGGIILLISPSITISGQGGVYANGGNSVNSTFANGGAGSGGSILIKCDTLTASNIFCSGGTQSPPGGWNAFGGTGGIGRIHVDYATSATVTNSTGVDTRQDATLKTPVGSILGGAA